MSIIRNALKHLIHDNMFFAAIAMQLQIEYTDKIPTAGVTFHDSNFHLFINPKFWNEHTIEEQVAILKHEILHLVFSHPARMQKMNPTIANYAFDITINQYIKDLPKTNACTKCKIAYSKKETQCEKCKGKLEVIVNGLLPEMFNAPREKNSEWYYNYLQQNKNKYFKEIQMAVTLDDHSQWDKNENGTKQSPKVLEEAAKQIIKQAHEAAQKDYGNIPSALQREIEEVLQEKLRWDQILRQFLYKASLTLKVLSRKKRNKRYGPLYPAQKAFPKLNILVGIDTSGSISPNQLKLFFDQLVAINNPNTKIEVVECDCEIQRTYEYSKNMKMGKPKGGGGTSFKPIFKYAQEKKHDAIIVLTDGYDEGEAKNPGIPVLWGVTNDGRVSYKFGIKINLPKEK